MKNLKYITWETADGIPSFVVFPAHLRHRDIWNGLRRQFRELEHALPVGAGFVQLASSNQGQQWTPYGRSESLGIAVHSTDFFTLNS